MELNFFPHEVSNSTAQVREVMRKKSESTTVIVMGGRNSVNPEQSREQSTVSSVVGENDTELEMESQLGSVGFSGSNISIQGESPYVRFVADFMIVIFKKASQKSWLFGPF